MLRPALRKLYKAARHPERAVLRLILHRRLARQDPAQERSRLMNELATRWGANPAALSREYRHSEFARWTVQRRGELEKFPGFLRLGTSGDFTCEALYLLARAARPRVVVETGVLYGASSGHLLSALAENGRGELYSIDVGCQPGEPPHDFFVPRELLPRWTYIRGDIREELPRLLARLGSIDMFHHDSLHTYEQMTWEYERAFERLNPGGVLSSHDVCVVHSLRTLFWPNAFPAFCQRRGLQWITFGNSGLAVIPESLPNDTPTH